MNSIKIILNSVFHQSISTRSAIEKLFEDISYSYIILDFTKIDFISSSASHQLNIEIARLAKRGVTITTENMNEEVRRMLELTKRDRTNIFTIPTFKHSTVRTPSDLDKLLLSL